MFNETFGYEIKEKSYPFINSNTCAYIHLDTKSCYMNIITFDIAYQCYFFYNQYQTVPYLAHIYSMIVFYRFKIK